MLWNCLIDSRSLFWMEPHVLIWMSLVVCSVHGRLCSLGFLGGAGRCLPSGPEPAQQPPACSCLFPRRSGLHAGERSSSGVTGSWLQSRAAVSLCPAPPITEWSCDRCTPSPRRGEVTESFGFNGSAHTRWVCATRLRASCDTKAAHHPTSQG